MIRQVERLATHRVLGNSAKEIVYSGSRGLTVLAKSIALLLAILTVSVFGVAQSTLDDYVLEQMKAKHIPSLELVVIRSGEIVKQRSYGLANVELNVPATNDNVYPIASITKVLTATATFLLIQDGKLRLDEPIAELLSGIPKGWNEVTVLNCLSHSSGIPDIPNIYDKFDYPLSEEAALAAASSQSLVYEPGEKSPTIKRNSFC